MSIQVYNCGTDGDFEIFMRTPSSVSPTETCPTCGKKSLHVFRSVGKVDVKQDWNEQANEQQRNELTKVEASQKAYERNKRERGEVFAPKNKDDLYKVALAVQKQDKQQKRSKFDYRTKSQRNN